VVRQRFRLSGRARALGATLAALMLAFALSVAPVASPHTRAQDDSTHLTVIQAQYHILLSSYWQPLDPADLLNAAWTGATGYLTQKGVPFSTPAPVISGDEDQAFATFAAAWKALVAETAGQADPQQLAFAADESMGDSLRDDHTGFIDPDTYKQLQVALGGADTPSIGIGISGGQNPPHLITDVAPGGPADQAGVRPGDTIVAIDGQDVTNLGGSDYRALLRKPAGATITLTVERPNAGQLTLTVTVGPYRFPIFSSTVLPGGIGYMQLRSFPSPWSTLSDGKTLPQELDDALAKFEQAGVTMWILDLRNNPGGSTAANQAVIGRFLADGRTAVAFDARGHRSESLVDGHPFPAQRPLAVLVNSNSFSSSEITASALHDYGRAILVGSQTGGGLATAEIFPLPEGAAVEVNVAPTVAGKTEAQIDLTGVPVDIETPAPNAEQLAAGKQADPAIAAAVKALQGQQVAPQPAPNDGTLPREQLQALLAPYQVTADQVPPAPEITVEKLLGTYTINTANEWVNYEAPAADAYAARQLPRQRGWQGAVFQFFGEHPNGAMMQTEIDLYATDSGAAAALASNDVPDLQDAVPPPIQLGDGTVAYHGKWLATGTYAITWRRGRVLFTVALNTVPGEESFDPLVQLAQTIDALWQAHPLP
jgi:carboxyl-terminal processing protease